MGSEPRFVGIDVSKAHLDVAVRPTGKSWALPNDETGIEGLIPQIVDLEPDLGVVGGYGRLGGALGGPPWPRRRCPWWWSTPARSGTSPKPPGTPAKTDTLDAGVLARFADVVRPGRAAPEGTPKPRSSTR